MLKTITDAVTGYKKVTDKERDTDDKMDGGQRTRPESLPPKAI